MTLTRQIVSIISLVFLLILAGVFVQGVWNTRTYLSQQLGSHAQDTATSLALSLGPVMRQGDLVAAQSLVDAIVDRGYYQRVEYVDLAGHSLLKREFPVVVAGVPAWFVRSVRLDAPQRDALVVAGWQQLGELQVVSHAGYAYRQLWAFTVSTALWLILGWLVAVLLVGLLLRFVMSPLRAVERQASDIGQGRFTQLKPLPRTRELRQVVGAMNRMAAQVERILLEKISALARIEQEAVLDAGTGLLNRQQIELRLTELLRAYQRPEGVFILIHLSGLEAFNNEHGYNAGNRALKAVAQSLRLHCAIEFNEYTLARFGGAEFALLVTGVGVDASSSIAQRLMATLPAQPTAIHMGMTDLSHEDRGALFGAADLAVRAAQSKGARAWYQAEPSQAQGALPRGAQAWRAFILLSLQQDAVTLQSVEVAESRTGACLHREWLAQLVPAGHAPVAAGAFMPMAEHLLLAVQLDRVIVQRALSLLSADHTDTRYALNLSPHSIRDAAFVEWLTQRLSQAGMAARRITLELASVVIDRPDQLRAFMQRLEPSGVRVGIDRVSAPVPNPDVWPGLPLAYIKLDAAYVMSLDGQVNMHVHLDALREFARSLGIPLIAAGIANASLRERAVNAGVDGLQGSYVSAESAGAP